MDPEKDDELWNSTTDYFWNFLEDRSIVDIRDLETVYCINHCTER